ncbi:MAG: transcription antitermination factor NusB [Candidatus Omnitrophica bacterium]|nr:transcription antitermination factor NusB [Candidatus Omnitrophota bacterium]
MRKRTLAREYALQILYQVEMNPGKLSEIIENFWSHQGQPAKEVQEFAEVLVKGTLQNQQEIDKVISNAAENWELGRMAVVDKNIMRAATYELLYLEDVPQKVSINEAVNMAKKFSQEDSGKFVNGILDKINHSEKPRYQVSTNESDASPV